MPGKSVLVAMSGGVDSSVAAALLKEQGYDVAGATMNLYNSCNSTNGEASPLFSDYLHSISEKDAEAARDAAAKLGIRHYIFDLGEQFREDVIKNFVSSYITGKTPNPCVICNRKIKFGAFLEEALKLGFDMIATGHYAVNEFDVISGRHLLKKGADKSKDQAYVLYKLTQEQLAQTLFPLGRMTKSEVRDVADKYGIDSRFRPESQDICFIRGEKYPEFIAKYTGLHPKGGKFTDREGRTLGYYEDGAAFTVGQRRGTGKGFGKRMYVISKNVEEGRIILGSEEDLYTSEFIVEDTNYISIEEMPVQPLEADVKTRYSQGAAKADIYIYTADRDNCAKVVFRAPQRAVTPGQAAVFYDGDTVIGGGTVACLQS